MSELSDLYQELILDHNKRPRNFHEPAGTNHKAQGHNPLCGDKVTIFLVMDGDVVKDIGFTGSGCAISMASASLMTESLKGKTRQEVEALFGRFHDVVTGKGNGANKGQNSGPDLGKLTVFSGVSEFPVRVKCASLPWHTLRAALEDKKDQVCTE